LKDALEGVPYMNLDNLLRDHARQDLCRFCPKPEHYMTDKELAWPLLTAPGLAPRERVAATALDALASFETLVKRTVEETTSPALDMDEEAPVGGMTFDQRRQIWARRELFRRAALVYARMLNDEQLIEHYLTPESAPEREPADSTAGPLDGRVSNGKKWTPEKLAEVAAYRKEYGTKKAAEHFKVSGQLIRQKLPTAKPKQKGCSVFTHRTK
jgi:hypothetical protein